ncbi:MAG: carboxymuconolactone decarboxylase family protein [Pleomorphochaeta sp.]
MNNHSNEKVFKFGDFVKVVDKGTYSMAKFRKERKLIDKNFESHIMLAVSQVNGCKMCSYLHTKHALESGSTEDEISQFLDGDLAAVNKDEAVALFFAQHYADSSSNYDIEAFKRVIETYGVEKAYGILATIRIIMGGNAHGITLGFFKDRFKGKRNKESNLLNEIAIIIGIVLVFPLTFIKNLFVRKEKKIVLS